MPKILPRHCFLIAPATHKIQMCLPPPYNIIQIHNNVLRTDTFYGIPLTFSLYVGNIPQNTASPAKHCYDLNNVMSLAWNMDARLQLGAIKKVN
jgi:hypothetical protein